MTRRTLSGKVHWLTVAVLVALVAVIGLLFFSKESPAVNGSKFMIALAAGDAKTLTQYSHMPGRTPQEIEAKWKYATEVVSPHYFFAWRIIDTQISGPESATVKMDIVRDVMGPSSFPEKFELPLTKVNGVWKVDVSRVDRKLYPGLPR